MNYGSASVSANHDGGSSGRFLGRPRGRKLASRPRQQAVAAIHAKLPNGRPRRKLSRSASTSASVWGRLTGNGAEIECWRTLPGGCSTGPQPILGARHQVGTHGVAFDVAEDHEQVLVVLNGERPEAPLPDMAAAVVVLVVAADVGGKQPAHVVTELTVLIGPEGEVKVVWHQGVGEQTHPGALAGLA